MPVLKRLASLLLALLLLAAPLSPASSQGLVLHEGEIKAGLLYNFLKYTDFPDGSGASINVCLYGDPFDGYVNHMSSLTVHEKPISVREVSSSAEALGCQLLFVSSGARGVWPQLATALRGKAVLTVSDFDGFAQSGGMIEFTRNGDHIGALLNIDAVNAAHLHVWSRMLRLAQVVHGGKG